MSQTPKRTVGRRKAAENSEKKWKEALEEEQTYEALPDVFLGSRIGDLNTYSQNSKKNGSSEAIVNHVTEKDTSKDMIETNSFTMLEDNVLIGIIENLACVSCFTQSLSIELPKNSCGQTQEISITCNKCNRNLFKNLMPHKLPQNYSFSTGTSNSFTSNSSYSSENQENGSDSVKKKGDGESHSIEELVCDVDVMKEDNVKMGEADRGSLNDFRSSSPKDDDPHRKRRRKRIISRVKKKQHIKPIRPCFFCSKMQARLSRHVKTAHAIHPYVQNLLRQPRRIQAKMMRQLRSEGIFAENQRRIKAGRYDLLRIRNQGTGELSACLYCRGYYKKKLLWRHRATCIARPANAPLGTPCHLGEEGEEDGEEEEEEESREDNNNWNEATRLLHPEGKEGERREETQTTTTTIASAADPPEICRIKQILDGLEHGIFSQTPAGVVAGTTTGVNGFFIKQEKEDYVEELRVADGHPGGHPPSATHLEVSMKEGEATIHPAKGDSVAAADPANEDQLLFDSLPAILSNSNVSSYEAYGTPTPLQPNYDPHGKKRKRENVQWNHQYPVAAEYTDENYYYMWQDTSGGNFNNQEFIPCNAIYQPNKKRKPRSEFQYQFWKKEDESTILSYFTDMIGAMKVPGKDACREFLSKNPDIKTDWTRVKYKVYNQIQKHKKRMKRD